MRIIIILAFLATGLSASLMSSAQVFNVPNKSKDHFAKHYPAAKEVDWINDVAAYHVKFKQDNVQFKAWYHADGSWDFTENHLAVSEIPASVAESLSKSRFSDWEKESVAYIVNSKKQNLYRIELKKGIEKKFVFFDKKGKEIKTSVTT
jgi:hypothetical protein